MEVNRMRIKIKHSSLFFFIHAHTLCLCKWVISSHKLVNLSSENGVSLIRREGECCSSTRISEKGTASASGKV